FLNREDLSDALKSLYMTYDATSPYPHKFNEVLTKTQMRTLQFHITNGIEKEYVAHYLTTLEPLLKKIKALVDTEGAEKGLYSMFEGTPAGYQLLERIDVQPGRRTFPCPYKEMLANCKKYLLTFSIEWNDVCSRWCTPTWTGVADRLGIPLSVTPGETCTVALLNQKQ
ncbi:MAG: hypothetical protein WCQ99_15440, partial [Pseudomonadota bacterium]